MPQDPEPSPLTTRPPLAVLTGELVQPPSRVYLAVDDRLYIRSRNSLAAVTLQVAGRLLRADGSIVPFNFEHVPATDRTASLESFRLAEGFLLSVVVFPSVGAPVRGQTYVEIGLLRGRDANAAVVDVLARDYVAEAEPLAFPGSPIRSSIEGPGRIFSHTGADPAAGAEISETVPTNALWSVLLCRYVLVVDATVASRQSTLRYTDGTNVLVRTRTLSAQTASQTRTHNYFQTWGDNTSSASATEYQAALPNNKLPAGFTIETETENIVAGDNYGAPQFLIEEWIED